MGKNKIDALIIMLLIVIVFLAVGIYYFNSALKGNIIIPVAKNSAAPSIVLPKIQSIVPSNSSKTLQDIQKNYPQIITGTIKFLDVKNSYKSTLTAADGTVYILWPAQPESVYKSHGAKNNGKIQVNGKILGNGELEWALMKPI